MMESMSATAAPATVPLLGAMTKQRGVGVIEHADVEGLDADLLNHAELARGLVWSSSRAASRV